MTKGKNNLDKALKVAKKLHKEVNSIQKFINSVNDELDSRDKTPAAKNSDATLIYIKVCIFHAETSSAIKIKSWVTLKL